MPLAYDDSLPPPDLRAHTDHEVRLMMQDTKPNTRERAAFMEAIRLRALVIKLQTKTP